MANNSVISNRSEWFFDPFQGMGGGYTGAGGAGGALGQATAVGNLGALGAALAAAIIQYKGNEKNKELYLPENKGKTHTTQSEELAKAQESTVIKPGIPSDLMQIGKEELPYLPNAGLIGQAEAKENKLSDLMQIGQQEWHYFPNPGLIEQAEAKEDKLITPGIPSDLMQIGQQELPYLPNAITKPQLAEKEISLPTIPPISEVIPGTEIKDETNTNLESEVSPGFDMQSMYDFIIQQQQRQWDREDAIRAETQDREDNAYQRAVEDMRKAGINPNLVGVNPAQSGGGITQATGLDYSPWTAEINKQLALMEQEIQNSFQGDENAKDRFTKGLTSLLQLFTMFALKG